MPLLANDLVVFFLAGVGLALTSVVIVHDARREARPPTPAETEGEAGPPVERAA